MTDPNVAPEKSFFRRLWSSLTGGSEEEDREPQGPTQADQIQSGGKRRMTSKEAAWWIGGRSPGDGKHVWKRIMQGDIEVVRRDGTIYRGDGG